MTLTAQAAPTSWDAFSPSYTSPESRWGAASSTEPVSSEVTLQPARESIFSRPGLVPAIARRVGAPAAC